VNLASIVEGHPHEAVAVVSRGQATTYGQLRADVARLRGALVARGLAPGDRVALLCGNDRLFVVGYLAVLGAGCVAVPLNPLSPPAELEAELRSVEPRGAIVGPSAAHPFDHDVEVVLTADEVDRLVATAEPTAVVERGPDDLAALLFTAGTAGAPKAAMLSHGNLHTNIRQAQAVPEDALRAGDVVLGVLPLFHVFGLNVILGVSLFAGARVVLVERFDPTTAVDTVRDHRCTIVAGAPAMWASWATLPGLDPGSFASVRLALSGAAPLSPATTAAMADRFGVVLREGYGLTEASPVVTSSAGTDPGTIGRPVPGVSVRLVDDDGEDVPLGDPGELWVQGPNVFAGYWRDADATAAALTPDGWLRTGDVAVADAAGALRLVDRVKDLIIVSGFNVFPAEVEEVLRTHPDVAAAAVVGVADPRVGEAVKAFVVVRPGAAVEEAELIQHCAERLARYKCPDTVLFVPELPLGLGGKVLRRSLRG
jgi:long-chain acyl-CoA synthetase